MLPAPQGQNSDFVLWVVIVPRLHNIKAPSGTVQDLLTGRANFVSFPKHEGVPLSVWSSDLVCRAQEVGVLHRGAL